MINTSKSYLVLINEKLRSFISISLGIFIFLLFFQPFPVGITNFDNSLIFFAGFAGIVFISLLIVSIIYQIIFDSIHKQEEVLVLPSFLSDLVFLALSSVAMSFYLRFVGSTQITFFIAFKIVFICIIPPIILRVNERITLLREQNKELINEQKRLRTEVDQCKDDQLKTSIEFISENTSENLKLTLSEIAFIRSADNYVEIVFRESEEFRKKLVRSTLRSIEAQLKPYGQFIRCHRTCVVNTLFIEKISKSYGNHRIQIASYPESLPVSRQYLLKFEGIT